jgi:hypothetical protein
VTLPVVGRQHDSWAAWPAFTTLAIALLVAILCGLPGIVSFVLIPLTVLGAPLVGAGLTVIALVVAVRRRPRMPDGSPFAVYDWSVGLGHYYVCTF